jgi:hypothetical protein
MKPLLLSTLLALSLVAPASAATRLSATSNTAMSITGDVTLAAGRITFGNGSAVRKIASGRDNTATTSCLSRPRPYARIDIASREPS